MHKDTDTGTKNIDSSTKAHTDTHALSMLVFANWIILTDFDTLAAAAARVPLQVTTRNAVSTCTLPASMDVRGDVLIVPKLEPKIVSRSPPAAESSCGPNVV